MLKLEDRPLVTPEDRQRGWVEVEAQLLDGSKHSLRLHALDNCELLGLASLDPQDALVHGLARALRISKPFAASIPPGEQIRLLTLLTLLTHDDAEQEMKFLDSLDQMMASAFHLAAAQVRPVRAECQGRGVSPADLVRSEMLKAGWVLNAMTKLSTEIAEALRGDPMPRPRFMEVGAFAPTSEPS